MTVWSLLEECTDQLAEPFRQDEIVAWFRRHHPEVNEATVAAHIRAATDNATNRSQRNTPRAGPPLLRRFDDDLYVQADMKQTPAAQATVRGSSSPGMFPRATSADVVLIGCARTKRAVPCPAAELFASPLFDGRRRYAVGTRLPWYILSAKFGLLAPDDVIGPYDLCLADQSYSYRCAWGEFVTAQLEQRHPELRGRTIEVHAGAEFAEPLRAPLAARGAEMAIPLPQSEQLARFNTDAGPRQYVPAAAGSADPAAELARLLCDLEQALTPEALIARGPGSLRTPGLYSWWVDDAGADDLFRGLGHPMTAGLIYAGLAGATRWPSGKRSASTLWSRIAGMHLSGSAEFSTFRRSLAAILGPVLGMTSEDDAKLSTWISAHLRVVAVPVPDPDQLGHIEEAVLARLDPPLNLRGRASSPIRERLSMLRRNRGANCNARTADAR